MRKIMTICAVFLLLFVASVTVYAQTITGASLGHKNDEFEYGRTINLKLDIGQYSKFYCDTKYHYATARVGVPSNGTVVYHQSKDGKAKGKKASAETNKYSSVVEWNSYYSHK